MRATATIAVAVALLALACGAAADTKHCDECWGKTSGPCRHNLDWSCHNYMSGTTCPPGTTECGPIDCAVSEWGAWSKCDADCGGGFQTRARKVTTLPSHGGNKCPVLEETRECNTDKCGTWLEWGLWWAQRRSLIRICLTPRSEGHLPGF